MKSWLAFWNGGHRIYVNDRHKRVHYERVADDMIALLPAEGAGDALDFGCGEALAAARAAARLRGRLHLYDRAPAVRAQLAHRFAGEPRIVVLGDAGFAALAPASLDLVLVNSVIQYVDRAELPDLFTGLARLVRPGGALVVADVVPPDASAIDDIASLLRTAWRHGFVHAAFGGLAATLFSDYRRLRARLGLARYDEAAIVALLRAAGLAPERRAANLGFHPRRMTFIGRRPR